MDQTKGPVAQHIALDYSQWQVPRGSAKAGLACSGIFLEYFPSFQWFLAQGFYEKEEVH